MRSIATHDRHGNISALTYSPLDAPPASVLPGPGQELTEVDVPEGAIDISRLENEQSVLEALRDCRVEVKRDAKLVRTSQGTS